MKKFRFGEYEVAYEERGTGEPLILLHNGGMDHRIWDHQIEHFSRTHRVLAIDHLGFGASDKPRRELPLSLFSVALESFIEELGLDQVNLAGNCMGSATALEYTLRNPRRVKRLVLCNITSRDILLAGPLRDVYLSYREDREAREKFIAGVEEAGMTRKQTDRFLRSLYGMVPPDDVAFGDHVFALCNTPGQMRSLYVVLSNFDHYLTADAFEKPEGFPPSCVIWGKENYILPPAAGEAFCARLQPERADFVEAAGHLVMREQPARVNATIESFLKDPV